MIRTRLIILSAVSIVLMAASYTIYVQPARDEAPPLIYPVGDHFEDVWERVDSLRNSGLNRSALKQVDIIYDEAYKQAAYAQVCKAILYRIALEREFEEEAYIKAIDQLDNEITKAPFPLKPVLHSVTAQIYWQYLVQNRWRFYDRTETVQPDSSDIRTWTLKQLVTMAADHYNASLTNADSLMRTRTGTFDDVIIRSDSTLRIFRPTLYDFLAYRALTFYRNSELYLNEAENEWRPEGAICFAGNEAFARFTIPDSAQSLKARSCRLLLDLCKAHLNDKQAAAKVDALLARLDYMDQYAAAPHKDSLELLTLRKTYKMYYREASSTRIAWVIAKQYNGEGDRFTTLNDTAVQWKKRDAAALCDSAIHHFPGSVGAKLCLNLRADIFRKSMTITTDEVVLPQKEQKMSLSVRNLDTVYYRLCPVDWRKFKDLYRKYYGDKLAAKLLGLTVVKGWTEVLKLPNDHQNYNIETALPAMSSGHYVLLSSASPDFYKEGTALAYTSFWVSNISWISRQDSKSMFEVLLSDRSTGSPLKDVQVTMLEEKYNYIARSYEWRRHSAGMSDQNGKLTIPAPGDYRRFNLEFKYNGEDIITENTFYQYRYYAYDQQKLFTYFFTDRAIYRPGQVIYFKGIMVARDGDKRSIVKDKHTTVVLYDNNSQEQARLDLSTNEFGTFSGSFNAPEGVLNGTMYIENKYGSSSFSVEEYKRPRFEIEPQPLEGNYRLNDTVAVAGVAKAFAGQFVDGATVRYRVVRRANYPSWCFYRWGYMPSTGEAEIEHGQTTTDEKGKYSIRFKAKPDPDISSRYQPYFTYSIHVDVIDINGETHSTTQSVTLGMASLLLGIDIPDNVSITTRDTFHISTTNLMNEQTPASGQLTIFRLKEPEKILRNRKWQQPMAFIINRTDHDSRFPTDVYKDEDRMGNWKRTVVFSEAFDTGNERAFVFPRRTGWKEGAYLVEIKAKDKDGHEVRSDNYFTLFNAQSGLSPRHLPSWFYIDKNIAEPGDTVSVFAGSAAKEAHFLYELEFKGKVMDQRWIRLNNSKEVIRIPVTEQYRGNFALHLIMINDNRVYQLDRVITVPRTDKQLDISFSTFRDKMLPGSKEEWSVKIKGPGGAAAAAEMLAVLYDASLDAFRPNNWAFNIYNAYYSELGWSPVGFSTQTNRMLDNGWNTILPNYALRYDRLNFFTYNGYVYGNYGYDMDITTIATGGYYDDFSGDGVALAEYEVMDNKKAPKMKFRRESGSKADSAPMPAAEEASALTAQDERVSQQIQEKNLSAVKARQNFSETAFFYPHLRTDENGDVKITFTVPESLTRWKFMGMAHTQDLEYGQITEEAVTQKPLMVMPNAPRFFREGDVLIMSAKISNMEEKKLKGGARIYLSNALNGQSMTESCITANITQPFVVDGKKSTRLSWRITIPDDVMAITYKVVAVSGKFSDGEENTLPVLSNRMLVTESLPLPVRGKGDFHFSFDKLKNSGRSTSLKHHRLTLEFTAHPAWYAIQSLPYLIEYPYECSEQTFSRYYANSLASYIANSNPKIKAVFDVWKNRQPDAFLSKLEKNQELKSLVLEETPWVLDARDEKERKKRVGLLFDLNRMDRELKSAFVKLRKAQSANGGWPWFKGMPESRYITQHIVCGFGHLDKLGVKNIREDGQVWNMLGNAVGYLDIRCREDYDWLKRHKVDMDENNLDYTIIQYLYARSYFDKIHMNSRHKEAVDYYLGQERKYWTKYNRYMQGMMALALHRFGDDETARKIMASLKENALHSDEMGMYWKDNYESYYWYQAPIESQALLIEAFNDVTADKEAVEEMKIWLLKSKQCQNWETTKATVEACYALLLQGDNLLGSDEQVMVKLGEISVDPGSDPDIQAEAGTGYFKTAWNRSSITPSMGEVTVHKNDEGVAWGALYWQYFEDLDKITPHKTPLQLEKNLFIVHNTSSGPELNPVTSRTAIKTGDKVRVHIVLRVDRDMEYVHLKDMRASGFEPLNVFSSYKWRDGLGYYESTGDAATNFFFDSLPKGTYVFEYDLFANNAGDFSNGIASIQCMYAPEFTAHSGGLAVHIEP